MSSALPTTLEEMQYEILQGDLSLNPKLQSSTIPAKDKELKTQAKKIIPAINELLKTITTCKQSVETYSSRIEAQVNAAVSSMEETVKQEQLALINEEIEKVKTETNQLVKSMNETLNNSYAETVQQQFKNLQSQIDELTEQKFAEIIVDIETKIEETISAKLAEQGSGNSGAGSEGDALKRVFHSKDVGTRVVCPFKMSEIIDFEKQIEIFAYSEKSGTYIKATPTLRNDSTSSYNIYGHPYDIRCDKDTDEVYISTTMGKTVLVYFYTLE